MNVPDLILQVWKLVLLGIIYLFFFRVLRAVWANLRTSTTPVRGAAAAAPPPRGAQPDSKSLNRLKVLEPDNLKGMVYELGDEITIGRAAGCKVSLADDTFVSQLHARVFRRDGQVFVEDLGSTNGTLCNGKKVSGALLLKKGDRVQVGRTVMEAQR